MISRLITVDGTFNFRDLGGHRAGGSRTRSGVLYRSDALAALSEQGREQLGDLGVTRVIDLRDDTERGARPDALPRTAALIPHPIFPSAAAHVSLKIDIYQLTDLIYQQHADTLAAAVALLADPESTGATVFHCAAGKDRTGAVAALALLAVGVDRDDVMSDYAESEGHLRGAWLDAHLEALRANGFPLTPEVEQIIGQSPIAAIERALTAVEQQHGSARDYLRRNGVTDAQVEVLHARLVG